MYAERRLKSFMFKINLNTVIKEMIGRVKFPSENMC